MSSDQQGDEIVFECDTCAEILQSGSGDWTEAWATAKEEGWRAYRIGDEWCHKCQVCSNRRN